MGTTLLEIKNNTQDDQVRTFVSEFADAGDASALEKHYHRNCLRYAQRTFSADCENASVKQVVRSACNEELVLAVQNTLEDDGASLNMAGFLLFGPKLVWNSKKINFGTKVLRDYTPYRTIRLRAHVSKTTKTLLDKENGLYTKWDSFTPRKYKINLIRTLTYRCFRICSTASLLQSAVYDYDYDYDYDHHF